MVHITIAEADYTAFDTWSEMPLSKAVELSVLCTKEMPGPLKSLYALYAKEQVEERTKSIEDFYKELPDEDHIKNFPAFYGKVIKCLTNAPQDVIDQLLPGARNAFYNQYLFKFVFAMLHHPIDVTQKGIESFVHKEITYHLPKSKNVLGEIRPMADRTAIEFAESADLELFSKQLDGGRFERAANIISILCRPMVRTTSDYLRKKYGFKEGVPVMDGLLKRKNITDEDVFMLEPYNEDTCLKRAEEFQDLPMSIVWEVFFCLMQQSVLLKQNILISSLEAQQKELRQEPVAV